MTVTRLSRRAVLRGLCASLTGITAVRVAGSAFASPLMQPAVQVRTGRPTFPSGVVGGDATADSAIVWARANQSSRMWVDWSTTADFANAQTVRGPLALADSDYSARVDLTGLPSNQDIFYRVTLADAADPTLLSEAMSGHFRTAPGEARRDVTFAFSGDTAGQGWGINPEWGGMRIYSAIRYQHPDFFVHSGDNIYADGPILPQVPLTSDLTLPDGKTTRMWKNLTIPGVEKVAETLDEYRARYRYNLLDKNLSALYSDTSVIVQWDDHEVTNNWWPGLVLPEDVAFSKGYTERRIDLLSAYATRAFFEYQPLRLNPIDPERVYRSFAYGPDLEVFVLDERTYRGPNSANTQLESSPATAFLGRAQMEWFKAGLKRSTATWKLIASDMPLGLFVSDTFGSEAWANNDAGAPAGRELELAEILRFVRDNGIKNLVWITADVHYAASLYYEPTTGAFGDFTPFWEFVSGPLNAGTFGPNRTDSTFGPTVVWNSVPDDQVQNDHPGSYKQFFGIGRLDGRTRTLTIEHYNLLGEKLWSRELVPS
jgi:alkaline phosphatase D